MGLEHLRNEIDHMRRQITRQRKDIQSLAHSGISTGSAEALLAIMQEKLDRLVAERDVLVGEQRRKYPGTNKAINGTPASRRV